MNFKHTPKKYPTWTDIPNWDGTFPRKVRIGNWRSWFAWYPVKVHSKRMWMKTVYRRKVTRYVDTEEWSTYEYGTIFDLLKV